MSQEDLAQRLEINPKTIVRWESQVIPLNKQDKILTELSLTKSDIEILKEKYNCE